MFPVLNKVFVLTTTLMLLFQSLCLAEPTSCSCLPNDGSPIACRCCSADLCQPATSSCPHCRKESAPRPRNDGESLHANATCHCQLTAPASNASLYSSESAEAISLTMPAWDATVTPFVAVCNPETSAPCSTSLPMPDTSFRRILLCVWLT